MLEHLHIRNLALIEDMSLDFAPGLNVLTGETGAGKSFILKALSFALGEKLGPEIVRPGAEKAQVEAIFTADGEEKILRRELSAKTGRSRFYINDTLSSQDAIKTLRENLLNHASQHAQQKLLNPAFQTAILESKMNAPELEEQKLKLLLELKENEEKVKVILEKQKELIAKRDLFEMQAAEIEKVAPKPNEEEELEKKRAEFRQQESNIKNYKKLQAFLHDPETGGLAQQVAELERFIRNLAGKEDAWENELETIEAFRQFLGELGNALPRPQASGKNYNIDAIEERLFAIAQLKRKLKRDFNQILTLKEELEENLSFLDLCSLDISRLNREKEKLIQNLQNVLNELEPLKKRSADEVARLLEKSLKELGFSEHIRVEPEFHANEIWPGVFEQRGRISWAPNPGQNLQPLEKIASGGELSRFLLALTSLNNAKSDLTYIFDEVDAGVGGVTLNKLADKIKNISTKNQILLITHWPQLAKKADKHFYINKVVKDNETFTQCSPLKPKEIADELKRMAGNGSGILFEI